MLHTFNARELINLQSETNFAFHSSITASDFPQVHDFFELSLVTAGKMLLGINDDVYEVEAGCLMLIPPGYVHTKQDLGGCRFMNIAFPVRTMEEILSFLGLQGVSIGQICSERCPRWVQISQPESFDLQKQLHRLSELPEDQLHRVRAGVRYMVLNCLWRWFIPRLIGTAAVSGPVWLQDLVAQLEKRENLAAGLPFMLAYSGKSQEYLCRSFQKYLSESPAAYLTRKRLDLAANLLAHTDMRPMDIAFEIGYQNGSTFYHNFTRRFGLAPGQYRTLYKERRKLAMSEAHGVD